MTKKKYRIPFFHPICKLWNVKICNFFEKNQYDTFLMLYCFILNVPILKSRLFRDKNQICIYV